jgi:hypothetical protein
MKTRHLKLLEKFFNGEMSEEEKKDFEHTRKNDPELDRDFMEYQQILESLKDTELLELRKKLNEIREEGSRPGDIISFFRGDNNWIWLAALLTIIVALTFVISLLVSEVRHNEPASLSNVVMPDSTAMDKLSLELRKFSMRKHGMALDIPLISQEFYRKENILFNWSVDSTYNLLLDVIDKEGNVVFVSHRPIESPFVFKRRMKNGSYIFRFRDDKETFSLTMISTH